MTPELMQTIAATWAQYNNQPQYMIQLMNQYGVSVPMLAESIGASMDSLTDYFYGAGAGDGWGGLPPYANWRGVIDQNIRNYWNQYKSNPQAIIDGMNGAAIDINELMRATGLTLDYLQNYFYTAGAPDGFQGLPSKAAWFNRTHPTLQQPSGVTVGGGVVVGGGAVTPNNAVIPQIATATQAPRTNVVDTSATRPVNTPVVVTQAPLANASGGGSALAWIAAGVAAINLLG